MQLTIATALLLSIGLHADNKKPDYPPSKIDPVTDTLHGVKITDPYRWLEDGESPTVKDWTGKQNAFTRAWIDKIPGRDKLRAKLDAMLDVGTISTGVPRGGHIFFTKREGKQNQPILYVENGGKIKLCVDPNPLSKDGTVTIDWWFPSKDGKLVAYGFSAAGSEQSALRIRDVESGKDLDDKIERTRACTLAWTPDSKGFYYTRYPKAGDVPKGEEKYHRHVFHHALSDDPAKDEKVFGEGRDPADWPSVALSPDGRWLVVTVEKGWAMTEVYFKDLQAKEGKFQVLVEKVNAVFNVTPRNDRFYVLTNEKAPRYKLMAADPLKPRRENWKEVIPEGEEVLEQALPVGKWIAALRVSVTRPGGSGIEILDSEGKEPRFLLGSFISKVGNIDSITGLSGEADGHELFFKSQSFERAPSIVRWELRPGALTKEPSRPNLQWQSVESSIDPKLFAVQHVKYPSKDGTLIPMFIISKRKTGFMDQGPVIRFDGKTPTVLYGYGGFNISLTPTFNPTRFLTIVEHGGIMAVANLRGGGEFGEDWHAAGMLGKKQNVFDDFIAAAEYLIAKKYTDADHLAIMGRSNGGLLVGAALTQRPDLFRAVVCGVPLLDMVRYHKFLIAKQWIPEYGSADEADEFKWLHAYSPYHRVKEGVRYPAVLFATGEGDSRVDPLHARKMTARLQAATGSDRPILVRIEEKAGHGQGKPRGKLLDEEVDTWSFLLGELGVLR